MTDSLTGVSSVIEARSDKVIPLCFNSSPGEGNCPGMVKHNNCPQTRGAKGRFPDCTRYIENFTDECTCCK